MARAFAKAFYNSQEWIKIARAYREKHFYICERCGAADAREVHHKIHLTPENIDNPAITLNEKNLELLCHECHYEEHHKERELQDKHERVGWHGLLQPEELYDFACFLVHYDWRIREPLGPAELLRAEKDGRFLSLYWDAERKKDSMLAAGNGAHVRVSLVLAPCRITISVAIESVTLHKTVPELNMAADTPPAAAIITGSRQYLQSVDQNKDWREVGM